MSDLVFFLIPIALLATAFTLGVGIYSLAKGGAFAKENANKLMRFRVLAQGIAVMLIVIFLWLASMGSGG